MTLRQLTIGLVQQRAAAQRGDARRLAQQIPQGCLLAPAKAALAFLLVGAGIHTVQTVGLALATDLAPHDKQPEVVAFLGCALLLGMFTGGLVMGAMLADFGPVRLIQVIQGAAVATVLLNLAALWKQEPRDPERTTFARPRERFAVAWARLDRDGRATRRFVVIGLGTAGFAMQDVLLEPYGGQILALPVGATTALSALFAAGGLAGFWTAGRLLERGVDPWRLLQANGVDEFHFYTLNRSPATRSILAVTRAMSVSPFQRPASTSSTFFFTVWGVMPWARL